MPPTTPGLALVGAMLVVPQFTLIHPYLHLLIIAPLLVWTGCQSALLEAQKSPEESQVRHVSAAHERRPRARYH